MSLATRCTSCNTVFKVAQDQLKVSKGWVRCGRCDTVFNALEELFELNGDTIIGGIRQPVANRAAAASQPNEADPSTVIAAASIDKNQPRVDDSDTGKHDEFSRSLFGINRKGPVLPPAKLVKQRDRNEFADAQFDSDLLGEDNGPGHGTEPTPTSNRLVGAGYTPPLPSDETPAFVRHADAQARWKSPRARLLLSMGSVLLLLGLALQGAHHFRDRLAVEHPMSRPALAQWCTWIGCRIEAYGSIKYFTVENSALTRMPGSSDTFRLSVTLRNRGAVSLRLPSLDLSVTDAAGQLLGRRALTPRDFQAQQESVKPNSEAPLQLILKSANPRINGYSVEVFYP